MQIIFLEVELYDPSEFEQQPVMEVLQQEHFTVLRVTRAASVAHVIAAVALELGKSGRAPEIHFGWTDQGVVASMFRFLLFGEGNVPWLVHELIRTHEPNPARQPSVFIGGR
jgi:hypothetical protein